MELTPQTVYNQIIDQQRIVVTGVDQSSVTRFIKFILDSYQRKYNHFSAGKLTTMAGAAVTLIEFPMSPELKAFHHHVLLLTPLLDNELNEVKGLLDATPKGGIIIYPEGDEKLKALVGKERADIQLISYKVPPHEVKNGQLILVSSNNEKFPIKLTDTKNLLMLAAAKQLVRKIGISSTQYYNAAALIE